MFLSSRGLDKSRNISTWLRLHFVIQENKENLAIPHMFYVSLIVQVGLNPSKLIEKKWRKPFAETTTTSPVFANCSTFDMCTFHCTIIHSLEAFTWKEEIWPEMEKAFSRAPRRSTKASSTVCFNKASILLGCSAQKSTDLLFVMWVAVWFRLKPFVSSK